MSRITFNNIVATSENGCFVGGDTRDKVNNIYFNNVRLHLKKQTDYPGGVYDKRPCRGEGFVKSDVYGVYVEKASNVQMHHLEVVCDKPMVKNFGGDTNL